MLSDREKRNKRQRERRQLNGNKNTKSYEKTPNGFLMRCYRNMQSRVTGVQQKKAHLYKGLELMTRVEFYTWARQDKDFLGLFQAWERSEYDRKLCPSINRVDSKIGYTLPNVEWITQSENSRLGALSKWKNK